MAHYNEKNSKRILLLDDEPDVTYAIGKVLADHGFVVYSYNDPSLVLSQYKLGLYDLLLLDIRMPKINGFELYQKIREIDSNVKICFITASEMFYEEYRVLDAYPRLNNEHFIQKPIRAEDLIHQINEILLSSH
ncbi:MAG TPA: response regulator [Nitrososphaeraceae archaeon]|nr:response regulator [Nitrososphaeraceae archaeon]